MSMSPTIKKTERITYINRLITELESINKQNDLIISQIPNQIQDSNTILFKFLENVEEYKPANQKNISKANIKTIELEKSINQLKTKIKDTQNRSNNVISQKDLERELQSKINQLDELRKKSLPSSTTVTTSSTSTTPTSITSSSSLSSTSLTSAQIIYQESKLKLIKSDIKNLTVSVQKIYHCTSVFYQTFKNYFNTMAEVYGRIPIMRGGLDIAGVLQIGGDESTEILERMCESIYQSSKVAWTFFNELPMLEKSWYIKNYKIYETVMKKTERDMNELDNKNSNNNSSRDHYHDNNNNNSNNNGNGKKKKPSQNGIKGVLRRLKKKNTYRSSIDLLEKVTAMENENETQQKLNQALTNNSPPLYSNGKGVSNNRGNGGGGGIVIKKIIYEPINSTCTLLDAIILDLDKLTSFPDKEVTQHIDSLERKCEMLFGILESLKFRFQYFREKFTKWYQCNTTLVRVASYEADPESYKIQDFRTIPDVQYKVKVLYKVMLSYFTTCLIATPMVYLSIDSWKLSNHSDYRLAKRKEIEKLLLVLKSNYPIDLDVLRKLILEFTDIVISALDIQIPLMLEVFEDDSTLTKRKNWSSERKLLKDTITNSINQLKYFQPSSLSSSFGISSSNNNNLVYQEMLGNSVQMIQGVLLHFFKFKPIGRPFLYKSDKEWTMVSESKKRYEYRTSILI